MSNELSGTSTPYSNQVPQWYPRFAGVSIGANRAFNPLLRWFLHWYANWNANDDVRIAINEIFDEYEQLGTYMFGTVYTIKAIKSL